MKKFFLSTLTCLAMLVPAANAVQLSDLSPTLTRTEADDNLTKDYAYRVLSDLSIRRIWNLDENRKLSIDFDGKTGKLICIVVDYRVPVALEDADRDAADIGKFDNAAWRKFDANKAAKYYMDRSRAMKFDSGYMFQELSGANKCLRLSFFPKPPKENRRHLSEGSTASATSALGSSLSGSAVKTLLQDEETRLYTPNKTDKAKEKPAPKPVIIEEEEPEEEPEIVEEEPETVEEIVEDTPQTGVVVKGPVKVKPIKTVKKKGDRSSDAGSFLAKMGLDGLKPIHWILICVGLVVLISIIGAIGRSNERRKLEQRAARLRQGLNGDKSKLRIK